MKEVIELTVWKEHEKELESIKPLIKDIQQIGMGDSPQTEYLFCLSSGTEDTGEIVDIGNCAGTSTLVISYAQKLKGRRKLHAIDLIKPSKKTLTPTWHARA